MGNMACCERDRKSVRLVKEKLKLDLEHAVESEKREVSLVPRKRDFLNHYKFVQQGKKKGGDKFDLQYFTLRRAKAVTSKKHKTYLVKECRKFHLNKVVRQLTMNEVAFVQQIVSAQPNSRRAT